MSPVTTRWMRRLLFVGGLCLLGGVGFSLYVGRELVAAVPRVIGIPPAFLGGETVEFESDSGSSLVGWYTGSPEAGGSILLLHAIRADRRSMVDRAQFLRGSGYNTLSIDFQAHGESEGEHITMGHLEAMDAAAGVRWLRERHPDLPVAVIGSSLGGAAALLADYQVPPEALVVEAVFADVATGISNRLELRFGPPGRVLSPLLTGQIRSLLGIDVDRLSPVRAASKVEQAVLVIYGAEDRRARPHEAKAIYQALAGPKEIWEIPGAAHVDFYRFAGAEYERRVGSFIAAHLRPGKDSQEETQQSP